MSRRIELSSESESNGKSDRLRMDAFASFRKREPYAGYYDQIAEERKELNDELSRFFGTAEKAAGFMIGAYGIYGSLIKSRRKWLEPPSSLVKTLPTQLEEKQLNQLSTLLRGLAGGNTKEAAAIIHQTKTIEDQILRRARLHSFGGLAVGMAVSQACDRMFFKHDTLGNGSAAADLLIAPMVAWRVPGNLFVKSAAVVAVELVGKLADHMSQPKGSDDPRSEKKGDVVAAPTIPLPSVTLSSEDVQNQKVNHARQQAEIDIGPRHW